MPSVAEASKTHEGGVPLAFAFSFALNAPLPLPLFKPKIYLLTILKITVLLASPIRQIFITGFTQ
jgi:hypothetical protein